MGKKLIISIVVAAVVFIAVALWQGGAFGGGGFTKVAMTSDEMSQTAQTTTKPKATEPASKPEVAAKPIQESEATEPEPAKKTGAYVFTEIPGEGNNDQWLYFNSVAPEGTTCRVDVSVDGGKEMNGWLFEANGHELHCKQWHKGSDAKAVITIDRSTVYDLVITRASGRERYENSIYWDETSTGMRIGGSAMDLNVGQYVLGMLDNLANDRDADYEIPNLEKRP